MQQDSVALSTETLVPPGRGSERYLPPAYLVPWAATGVLCAMRRVEGDVLAEEVPPEATGFVPEFRDSDAPLLELTEQIEQRLAALALAEPAAALQPILERRAAEWDAATRANWARFIASLMLRNPSVVTQVGAAMRDIVETGTRELQTRYATRRSDPKTFAEYVTADPQAPLSAATGYLQKVMDGDAMAAAIKKMQWVRITVANARFTLLTSDQPLDVPLSLSDRNAYVALPLSPTALFVASNNESLLEKLTRHDPSKLVRMMNMATVTRARDYVWSVDDSQHAFVRHHFGAAPATAQLSDSPRQDALAALKRRAV
jgi:Protein of unknown function (DUF4238)